MITTIIANDPVAILELVAIIFTLACIVKLAIFTPEESEIRIVRTCYHPAREIFRKGDFFNTEKSLVARNARFKAF